jgi:hypothetical protein
MTLCTRPGCTSHATGKYCSKRCSAIARLCAGWRPQATLMRADVRAVACRRGALAKAATSRRQRAKATVARIGVLLTARVLSDLDAEQRAAVTALLARSYRIGKADGYQRGYHAKEVPALKRRRETAA